MLREFLKNMGHLCTNEKDVAKRIGLSAKLDFDYEIKNPHSAFAFKGNDRENPRRRMEHLFLFKHLDCVDTKKAERCELLVNLLALHHYKEKYQTEEFDEEISVMTATVKSEPIPEVDSQLPLTVVAQGWWGD